MHSDIGANVVKPLVNQPPPILAEMGALRTIQKIVEVASHHLWKMLEACCILSALHERL